jgi:hypothetical protein
MNKTAFDKSEMNKKIVPKSKESAEHTYYHPLNQGGEIRAYPAGSKVKTDIGEAGEVSHIRHGEGTEPHLYRVSSLKNPENRLERGNYIPHTRLMPHEQD